MLLLSLQRYGVCVCVCFRYDNAAACCLFWIRGVQETISLDPSIRPLCYCASWQTPREASEANPNHQNQQTTDTHTHFTLTKTHQEKEEKSIWTQFEQEAVETQFLGFLGDFLAQQKSGQGRSEDQLISHDCSSFLSSSSR